MVDPKKLSVKATYWINGEQTEMREFDGSTIKVARIGLPPDTPATKPEAGDFSYSGRHDGGVLPPPREGGSMAKMIACVQEAKNLNDEYLTKVIGKEKEEKPLKKAKI